MKTNGMGLYVQSTMALISERSMTENVADKMNGIQKDVFEKKSAAVEKVWRGEVDQKYVEGQSRSDM